MQNIFENPEDLKKLKKAGEIGSKVRQYAVKLTKKGISIVELADKIETKIVELGGRPSFQACISINDIAAHYAPVIDDVTKIKEGDYVKLDLGAHVDGFISDTAVTVRPAGKDKIIECSEKMLDAAIKMFRPGTAIEEVSAAMENVANDFGLKSIGNLTGHSIERFNLHAGLNVPAVKTSAPKVLSEGEVFAIEPFATNGKGWVKDSPPPTIFRWIADAPQRDETGRKILHAAKTDWEKLPFAKRWVQKKFGMHVDLALNQLVKSGALYSYNILKEQGGGMVAQTEHTVIVADKPIVTTL